MQELSSIGYEGASLSDFVATLREAKIEMVVDVRDVPASRRPGFSKNVLMDSLKEAGIAYRHFKALGDPKAGREAARRGDIDEFKSIFHAHLSGVPAQAALTDVAKILESSSIVLLCYERDHKHCHRTIVAEALGKLGCPQVRNLGVRKRHKTALGSAHGGTIGGIAVAIT